MTEASEAGSTAATMPTEGGTTTDTGDTTGGPDCEAIDADMATCQATPGCAWDAVIESCVIDCDMVTDEAICLATNYCLWFDGDCFPPL